MAPTSIPPCVTGGVCAEMPPPSSDGPVRPPPLPVFTKVLPRPRAAHGPLMHLFFEIEGRRNAALEAKAKELMASAGATAFRIERNPASGIAVIILSWPPKGDGSVDYRLHHVRFDVGKLVVADQECQGFPDELAFQALNRIISAQHGKPITLLSLQAKEAEAVEGPFDPDADPGACPYLSIALTTAPEGRFSLKITPKPFSATWHAASLADLKAAEKFFRENLVALVDNLKPDVPPFLFGELKKAAAITAKKFRWHVASAEESQGSSAAAFADKYIEVQSGLSPDVIRSKMLHELIHLMSANIDSDHLPYAPSDGGDAFRDFLTEDLTEYLTRRMIIAAEASIDFERCPCIYSGADLLFLIHRAGFVEEADIVEAFVVKDASPFMLRMIERFGEAAVNRLFFPKMDDGLLKGRKKRDVWFALALKVLQEEMGLTMDWIRTTLAEGEKEGMVTKGILARIDQVFAPTTPSSGHEVDLLNLP